MTIKFPEHLRKTLDALEPNSRLSYPMPFAQPKLPEAELLKNSRKAAVLIPLIWKQNSWHMVFIKRPEYEGVHGGQIAFPGGKVEPEDSNLWQTAERETLEEIGVDGFKKIGAMQALYIPPSRFLVQPYIGVMNGLPEFSPDPKEVEQVHVVPLDQLKPERVIQKKLFVRGHHIQVPGFPIDGAFIWGATASILAQFWAISKDLKIT